MAFQVIRKTVTEPEMLLDSADDLPTFVRLVAVGDGAPPVELGPKGMVYGEGFPLNGFIPAEVTLTGEELWAASPPEERGERKASDMSIDELRDELQGIPKKPQWASPPSRTGNAAANRRKKLNDWKREHGKRYEALHDELKKKLDASRAEGQRIQRERIAAVRAKLRSGKPLSEMRGPELDTYLDGLMELRRGLQRGPDTDETRAEWRNVDAAIERVRRELDDRR